jgi:hypothetical protein
MHYNLIRTITKQTRNYSSRRLCIGSGLKPSPRISRPIGVIFSNLPSLSLSPR